MKFWGLLFILILSVGCTRAGDIYPDTDEAPVLEFYFDNLDADNIVRVTPYGIWEGTPPVWEPATEMQFYTRSYHDPVYAPAPGVIVDIDRKNKRVIVRYGRNYGYTMHHIVDTSKDLKPGMKVEEKTVLGYTEHLGGEGWWEIELALRRGDVYRTLPPYDYFSEDSKKKLNFIIANQNQVEANSWTVREGENSWIQQIGSDEWYTSAHRIGMGRGKESASDFLKAHNLSWMEENYGG